VVQRAHEKLAEEEGVRIPYPTLTRKLRALGLGAPREERCARVPDEPGAEMRHDTPVYEILLGGQRARLIASLLCLRYSKRRYLKFYRAFNRFKMNPVKALEYADRLRLRLGTECLAEYSLPADGARNAQFSPPGQPAPPGNANNRKQATQEGKKRLRSLAPSVNAHLTFALKPQGIPRHRFIRELFALSRQMTAPLFVQTVERALRYRIANLETLRRIAQLYLTQGEASLLSPAVDEGFRERDAYRQGHLTDAPDLSRYDNMLEAHDG
jgi:hypothetical protein